MSSSDLAWSELASKPVEYVAAMSAATGLGADTFRARDYDRAAFRRAVLLLARKAWRDGHRKKLPISDAMSRTMAAIALFELCSTQCRICRGAGVSVIDQLKVICQKCGGVQVHRYADRERAMLCGLPVADWHKYESRYLMVMDIAQKNDYAPAAAAGRLG
jgi:hypothetical protein